jgi:hypothetical protein
MVWLRSLAITLALGSATCAFAQSTGYQPVDKNKPANLLLFLQAKNMQMDMPQAFAFVLVNISDHDMLIPPKPNVDCSDLSRGSLWLRLKFTPLTHELPGLGRSCVADYGIGPGGPTPILEQAKEWKVLHAGESLTLDGYKYYEDKDAGTYEFWAEYQPPYIATEDQAVLQKAGIDFPHGELASAHITFVKKP